MLLCLLAPVAIADSVQAKPLQGENSELETPLERSVRLNNFLNGGKDRISTLEAPVTDPDFNTMRQNDPSTDKAKFYVIGLLIVASITPVVIWLVLR